MVDIFLDSKKIKKGDYYISLKGTNYDGIKFLDEVINKGGKLLFSDDFRYNYYPNLKLNLNKILLDFYEVKFSFKLIGITGTNRKTSTAYLVNSALNRYGYKSKVISTIKEENTYYYSLTTPRNDDLIRIFKKADEEQLDYLIMEVSSIGIEEARVHDISFDYAILTSLESDHLDYHKDIISYHLSKIKWLEKSKEKLIGINKNNDTFLREILSKFLKKEQINEFLINLPQVPGREEIVSNKPLVIVDYAHTSSALEYLLSKYKKITKGKLISILGAGGSRDKSKRRIYGELVHKYSNVSIITSDNPRNENPLDIINEIIDDRDNVYKIVNREDAIKFGISILKEVDTLLVIGKGNEEYMEINNKKIPYSDKKIIYKYLNID